MRKTGIGKALDDGSLGGATEAGDESFAALLAASETNASRRRIAAGDMVRGRVVEVGALNAFVEIGGKCEAVMDINEFRDRQTGEIRVAIGDEIEATVSDDGNESGTVVLKRAFGRSGRASGELEQALAHGIPVEGLVTGAHKGGFDVQIGSVRAFCPGSQIDRRRGEPAEYVGQRLQFRVTRIDGGGRNVVVSRRQLLEEEHAAQAASTWERLQPGATLSGTVTSVRDFGAFVDLGGVEGLIHVSELGHGRPRHPSEVISPGQTVEVKVLKVEPASESSRARIALSLRALEPDPWTTARERFPIGTTVRGRVRRLESYGAFVELANGIDGLVHVSKMALDRRVAHPKQVVNIGDEVEVTITTFDHEQRRIGLSMVEESKRLRDANEAEARDETRAAVVEANERRTLGTFSELLEAQKKAQP